ncbi:fimbrial protein [Citrobacter rodentium]|uniref:Fimbrial subunit n=2 Tax=Citrobacter rodentium TaxID=67825 RepID=D2THU0_CITRI|nr:fimbrial protein [Citrobacter rodentium]KIQ49538.1 F17 fimbrial protein [Citrobacter rodentium]QBY29246.1 type 1 fimbrial protein [Citrobacter rodentium]UHO33346.1 fimbrial protein [Citrobacter rodentium NBRC 105723 = DSM 16636]CBG89523.1 putative fimbrial subunit [Citrobacter rodentium ICC168]HAT8012012.1 type 1 fimbrial protein [Citrobacter rodentium NBRC 105723 = DSM 16636]
MSTFKITLCALAMASVSTSALAVTQGTVTFNGELISSTCEIAADSVDRQVQLPKIAIQTLAKSGDTAGSKGFDLNVEKCPAGITKVAAHFEAIGSSGVDSATGNLTNQFKGDATTPAAENVQVRLYNSDEKQLKLGETGAPATVTGGSATMRYYGGYYATDTTSVGKVYAQAAYTIAYP